MIKLRFILRSPRGCCYGNQLLLGSFHRRRNRLPSLFTLVFQNGLQYRYVNTYINSTNNMAISCKNLVNFGPVTPEFKRLECAIFVATQPQFDDLLSFGTLAFQNRLEYYNFNFSRLIGNYFSTSCRNLVRYRISDPGV